MRRVALSALFILFVIPLLVCADDAPKDTPNGAKTREKLKKKIKVEWKDTRLEEIVDDLKEATGVSFHIDTASGVSKNAKFTYKAKDKPADEVLSELLDKGRPTWGWYVISKEKDAYDGDVKIRVSEERGVEKKGS
jgi:hypothetical protein